jgi:DNA-binding transcriptional ArsR family regulator
LANGERSVGELAQLLGLKEPTVSHHLAELKGLGLVDVRPEGTTRIYQLNARALETIGKDIFARPNLAALVPKSELNEEERVLRTWVKDGRSDARPGEKKIVIRWLAGQIDPARRWTDASSAVAGAVQRSYRSAAIWSIAATWPARTVSTGARRRTTRPWYNAGTK